MITEYWVNVYDNHNMGACCVTRALAVEISKSRHILELKNNIVIYRIHVKMKYVTGRQMLENCKNNFKITIDTGMGKV